MVMLAPATKVVGPYLVPVESAARIWPSMVGADDVPVPPFAGVKALVKVRALKVGEALVLTSWLMLAVPETVKVLEPKVSVPVPAVMVLPLMVLAVNWVMVVVAKVEVPVTPKVPPTVSKLEIVVEPVTVKVLPPTK